MRNESTEQLQSHIARMFYYMQSIKKGHKYIWQSLPRSLELWFSLPPSPNDKNIKKINDFMKKELTQLETYKLATV